MDSSYNVWELSNTVIIVSFVLDKRNNGFMDFNKRMERKNFRITYKLMENMAFSKFSKLIPYTIRL